MSSQLMNQLKLGMGPCFYVPLALLTIPFVGAFAVCMNFLGVFVGLAKVAPDAESLHPAACSSPAGSGWGLGAAWAASHGRAPAGLAQIPGSRPPFERGFSAFHRTSSGGRLAVH